MKKAIKVLRWIFTITFVIFAIAAAGESDYMDATGNGSDWTVTILTAISGILCIIVTAYDMSINESNENR